MVNSISKFLTFLVLLKLASSLYSSAGPVVMLTESNFKKEVLDSKDIWLIEFFAPWCGHCKGFAPEYEKAARALKGVFKIGAVDADSQKSLGAQFGISGFPTVKFFGANKSKPEDYQGQRTADAIISYMFDKARSLVNARMNPSKKSSSSSNNQQKKADPSSDKDVIILTDDNFDNTVYNSKDMWLIEFYAPWCGHCQKLQPDSREYNHQTLRLRPL